MRGARAILHQASGSSGPNGPVVLRGYATGQAVGSTISVAQSAFTVAPQPGDLLVALGVSSWTGGASGFSSSGWLQPTGTPPNYTFTGAGVAAILTRMATGAEPTYVFDNGTGNAQSSVTAMVLALSGAKTSNFYDGTQPAWVAGTGLTQSMPTGTADVGNYSILIGIACEAVASGDTSYTMPNGITFVGAGYVANPGGTASVRSILGVGTKQMTGTGYGVNSMRGAGGTTHTNATTAIVIKAA